MKETSAYLPQPKKRSHDLAVSALLSFVLKQMQRAKCFPASALKFRAISNANYMSLESILLFDCPDATYAMGQQPKTVGVCNTWAVHLYSTSFNPAVPAQGPLVPEERYSSYEDFERYKIQLSHCIFL